MMARSGALSLKGVIWLDGISEGVIRLDDTCKDAEKRKPNKGVKIEL